LNEVDRHVPSDLDVHLVLDNLQTHTIQKWLLRHRRVRFHFTAHPSVGELAADITAWVETWNENPHPVDAIAP